MSEALTHDTRLELRPSQLRRFLKRGPGKLLFRSEAYRRLLMLRHFASSWYAALAAPQQFSEVRTYCMFVGHNKSGTSMIGSLLDAHPDAILSDEADALEYVRAGFSREQIFHILLRQSRKEARKGRVTARRLQPYSYLVPGQWQGRYHSLKVIGDSTAGSSTRMLAMEPDVLERLQKTLGGVELRVIQIIRNPYDPISAMMVRGGRSFDNAIRTYFSYCETLAQLRQRLDPSRLFPVHYEDFVLQGGTKLAEICRFLGLEVDADYLNACTTILHATPQTSRQLVDWDAGHIAQVAGEIERFDFLHGYSFES